MTRLAQPRLGLISAIVALAASLLFVGLFSWPTFGGWVSVGLMCAIPTAIIVGAFARDEVIRQLRHRPQPVRGLVLLVGTAVVALVVAVVHGQTIGGGISPPVPMLAQAIITSVLVTFWLVIVWGGWPFSLIPNRLVGSVALLLGVYVVNALQFHLLFNYAFLRGAPVYRAALDPQGVVDAWDATVFGVTMLAVMFLLLHLDLWPLSRVPALSRQPSLGLAWTAVLVVVAAPVFWLGTRVAGLPDPVFLVRVPIPFIFGSVLMLNTFQGSLVSRLRPPVRGVVSAVAAAALGSMLAAAYSALMPVLTGSLASGPPSFDAELWLANALLAVTFPLLAIHADYFDLWPFAAPAPGPAAPAPAPAPQTREAAQVRDAGAAVLADALDQPEPG
jgi:hypothetical protein